MERGSHVIDIDAFEAMANEFYEEIPERLLEGLNGGIVISEEARPDEDLPDVYILGEYIEDPHLGQYVVLYYGSFAALFGDEPVEVWEDELWETMIHEIRHHVEHRAGVYDLDIEDMRLLEELRRSYAGEAESPSEPESHSKAKTPSEAEASSDADAPSGDPPPPE